MPIKGVLRALIASYLAGSAAAAAAADASLLRGPMTVSAPAMVPNAGLGNNIPEPVAGGAFGPAGPAGPANQEQGPPALPNIPHVNLPREMKPDEPKGGDEGFQNLQHTTAGSTPGLPVWQAGPQMLPVTAP
jgi:hypothetical protein